jgi:hypothetical protein
MKLVIDRTKWLRGKDWGVLVDPASKTMCCLGFLGLALGKSKRAMAGKPSCQSSPKGWPKWMLVSSAICDSQATCALTSLNDDPKITDKVRESKLTTEFKKHNIHVTFIGDKE